MEEIKLSEDAQEFLENLSKIEGIDVTNNFDDQLGDQTEIGYEVGELIKQAENLESYDADLTEDQKALITSLIWTIANRTGLNTVPAGAVVNKDKIRLKKSTKIAPASEVLADEFYTLIYKNMYIAACLVMKREQELKG